MILHFRLAMASNGKKSSNTDRNLDGSGNSTRGDSIKSALNGSGKCRAIIFDIFSILAILVYRRPGNVST